MDWRGTNPSYPSKFSSGERSIFLEFPSNPHPHVLDLSQLSHPALRKERDPFCSDPSAILSSGQLVVVQPPCVSGVEGGSLMLQRRHLAGARGRHSVERRRAREAA